MGVERGGRSGGSSVVDVPGILQQFQLFLDVKVRQIQFIDRVLACSCATEVGTHSANCAEECGDSAGAVQERVDTKNACDDFVCAAEESGDNGLIELDEDVEEQILDAFLDGLGANIWVDVAVIMQRQVSAIRGCIRSVHRQRLWLLLAAVKGLFAVFTASCLRLFRTPPHEVESWVSSDF